MLHDLGTIEAWLESHPTDSSGWAYMDFLLQSLSALKLLDSTEARSMLHTQLRTVTKTLEIYPERECLWMFKWVVIVLSFTTGGETELQLLWSSQRSVNGLFSLWQLLSFFPGYVWDVGMAPLIIL